MAHLIRATYDGQEPVTHEVCVGEFEYDRDNVMQALARLFRKFELPEGSTLRVEGYGKVVQWEHDGFLNPLASILLS